MSSKSSTEETAGNAPAPPTEATTPNTVTLETPIKRGDQVITSLSLRKPAAGELRGVALADLLRLDVAALITLALGGSAGKEGPCSHIGGTLASSVPDAPLEPGKIHISYSLLRRQGYFRSNRWRK